jgi:hypothetical protein
MKTPREKGRETAGKQEERRLDEALKELMDGKLIGEKLVWRNLGFIFFITSLAIFYIWNRNKVEGLYRERKVLTERVREERFESLVKELELMRVSSRAEVTRRVQEAGLGLETSGDPPICLEK